MVPIGTVPVVVEKFRSGAWRFCRAAMVYVYLALYIHPLYIQCIYTVYTYLLSQIHVFRILNPFPATEISTFVNVITSFSSQNFCKAHFS